MKTYLPRTPIRIMAFAVIIAMLTSLLPAIPKEVSAASLQNPRSDGDTVTWDCVWFGHYPQGSDGNGGHNNAPIKWRVLSIDGDEALLLADKSLDCKQYNETDTNVTWETSTVRSWLNGYGNSYNKDGKNYTSDNFIDKAFTSMEQAYINQNTIQNPNNPVYDTEGGNDTEDKIFFLSIDEVTKPTYGFPSDYDEYSKTRRALNTDYAKSQGAWTTTYTEYEGNGDWWLRSPGYCSNIATRVACSGIVGSESTYVDSGDWGIRPALFLNLKSGVWSSAGTVSSDGTVDETGGGQGGSIGDAAADYTVSLDEWLSSRGTNSSIKYLTNNEHFVCSAAVAKSDASFADHFVQTMTNMIYRGLDGWKDIFALATTKEQAQEVIVALLDSQGEEVQELADAEVAYKYAKTYVDALKNSNWAYAVEYGLNSSEIKKLEGLCTEDTIADFFIKGEYDEIAEYLKTKGGYSDDSPALQCVKQFSKSKELAQNLSDGLGMLGDGMRILSMTDKTIRNVYDVERLANADEMFSEMLLYLRDHSVFVPVKEAASDLYDVIHGGYLQRLGYATTELQNAATDEAVDLILEGAAKALPYGEVVKTSFVFAAGISNAVFNTGDTQKQKDNMRCVAYIGECLSEWLLDNKERYSSQSGEDKTIYAKKTVYAYYMLLKTRMAGEKSLQKMMELSRTAWKKAYTLSLEVSAILKSNEEWLKLDGVLNNIATSVIACPVDVEIRDASGKLIQTVRDGVPVEGYVKDVYYCAAYQPLDQDYVKIIRFPSDKGYMLKCVGTDLGTVDYFLSTISDKGTSARKEARNVPVKKGSIVEISGISENKPACVLREDGKTVECQVNTADEYVAVRSLRCEEKNVALTEGEKKRINVVISPTNASIQEVAWTSSAPSVATVNADGVVTALSQGEATIQAKTVDGGFTAQCKVAVTKKITPPATMRPSSTSGSEQQVAVNGNGNKAKFTAFKAKIGDKIVVAGVTYQVTKNNTVTYQKPKKNAAKVTIPAIVMINGKTYKVTAVAKNAFKGNKKVKTVVVGKNVTTIGDGAFQNCKALTTVTLPAKTMTIGKNAFAGSNKLKKIVIKSTKMTNKSIKNGAFKKVSKKTTVDVPNKKAKTYKKLFQKKGLPKACKVK